jgi:hypothetical protein
MLEMIALFDIIARVVFVIVTTVIFGIALLTFSRLRNKKTLFLTVGFGLFFIHGLISIPEIISSTYNMEFTDSLHLLIDAIALLFLLIGVLQD